MCVCLIGLLATLAALLIRFFMGNKEVMGRISYSATSLGCHGASTAFLQTAQCTTDGPFIVMNIKYVSVLFVGVLSHFPGDGESQRQFKADVMSRLIVEKLHFHVTSQDKYVCHMTSHRLV